MKGRCKAELVTNLKFRQLKSIVSTEAVPAVVTRAQGFYSANACNNTQGIMGVPYRYNKDAKTETLT